MHRWVVLWQASTLFIVGGSLDFGYFTRQRFDMPTSKVNCIEMPNYSTDNFARKIYDGWRFPRYTDGMRSEPTAFSFLAGPLLSLNRITPRVDRSLPAADDIVKEHAKLVQDINSLKQAVFVSPFAEENRDYDESIFPELIETTTNLPKTTSKSPPKRSSIPVVLLGGGSTQRQTVNFNVRSQPIKFPKTSISLVGTTTSPFLRHPYPFVGKGSRPMRVCMSAAPTTQRPSLLQRLLNAIIPR